MRATPITHDVRLLTAPHPGQNGKPRQITPYYDHPTSRWALALKIGLDPVYPAEYLLYRLPYRGLGTGICRALDDWPAIEFTDDRDGNQFTVTVYRQTAEVDLSQPVSQPTATAVGKEVGKGLGMEPAGTREAILVAMRANPKVTTASLANDLGVSTTAIEKQIKALREAGHIRRVGGRSAGSWEVLDSELSD